MAVYTEVSDEALSDFLALYDIGDVVSFKGIAEGVENSNFLLRTSRSHFILTLYEKRVKAADLPFFVGLMEHLAERGVTSPQPVRNRVGEPLGVLAGRPAAIVTFLDGLWIRRPHVRHCGEVGRALARMHLAGADFGLKRANALSLAGWPPLFHAAEGRANEVAPRLREESANELAFLQANWNLETQAKILRVLQDRKFMHLGGVSEIQVDVRIIAATNVNLQQQVKDGKFRDDLFYRLNVITIDLPPLRQRKNDIPMLVAYFIAKFAEENERLPLHVTPEAMRPLLEYDWPGNVRELENVIERAVVLATEPNLTPAGRLPVCRKANEPAPPAA